ncbi:hypothetical protein V2J09_005844 [Rumex salicifolius]
MERISEGLKIVIWAILGSVIVSNGQPIVPAIISFGDSSVDVGNNDYLPTIFKANYPPYGRDFTLGFTSSPPAYLSPQASGKSLLIGANFASAGSGYDDQTAILSHAIPLSQQLEYFKEYKGKLAKVAGNAKAKSIVNDALYIIGAGGSDFVLNYYVNPLLNKVYTPDEYGSHLVEIFSSLIKELYKSGARRIGVTALPPVGCLPATVTLFGFHKPGCVARINNDAQAFNKRINVAASHLKKQLHGLKLVVFDIYKPFYDLVKSPSKYALTFRVRFLLRRLGFAESGRGCCGTGTVETTALLCNPKAFGTCKNASQYVFWDSVHPSQAANQLLADQLINQGIELVT